MSTKETKTPPQSEERPKSRARLSAERELNIIRRRYPVGSPIREALIRECRDRYRRRGIIV